MSLKTLIVSEKKSKTRLVRTLEYYYCYDFVGFYYIMMISHCGCCCCCCCFLLFVSVFFSLRQVGIVPSVCCILVQFRLNHFLRLFFFSLSENREIGSYHVVNISDNGKIRNRSQFVIPSSVLFDLIGLQENWRNCVEIVSCDNVCWMLNIFTWQESERAREKDITRQDQQMHSSVLFSVGWKKSWATTISARNTNKNKTRLNGEELDSEWFGVVVVVCCMRRHSRLMYRCDHINNHRSYSLYDKSEIFVCAMTDDRNQIHKSLRVMGVIYNKYVVQPLTVSRRCLSMWPRWWRVDNVMFQYLTKRLMHLARCVTLRFRFEFAQRTNNESFNLAIVYERFMRQRVM